MLAIGIGLFVLGTLIAFIAFAFIGANLWRAFVGFFSEPDPAKEQIKGDSFDLGKIFKNHLGAMIAMVSGGLCASVGIVLIVVYFGMKLLG